MVWASAAWQAAWMAVEMLATWYVWNQSKPPTNRIGNPTSPRGKVCCGGAWGSVLGASMLGAGSWLSQTPLGRRRGYTSGEKPAASVSASVKPASLIATSSYPAALSCASE